MKHFVLFLIILMFAPGIFAQKRSLLQGEHVNNAVPRHFKHSVKEQTEFIQRQSPLVKSAIGEQLEEVIGTTWYDLQSNGSLGNRVHLFHDGTLGAVWTIGFDNPPNFPDRGTGYNYYDGSSWGPYPTGRIETIRAGWPSIAPYGEDGEIVGSHDFSAGTILTLHRENKGTGSWIGWPPLAGPDNHKVSWPRISTSGQDNSILHYLYVTFPVGNGGTSYNGMDGAMLYSRTSDGGVTWDFLNVQLEGTGPAYYNSVSADEYVWAEPRANTIAFVCADAWHDMFVMKSTDNGDNWERIMVWEHPYPFFDWNVTITTDTIWCPDNSADIALDNTGKAHVVFGISRVAHFELGPTYSYWPWTDGIGYWNEDMPPFEAPDQHDALNAISVLVEDYNLIGWTQDTDGNGIIELLPDLMSYRELGISTMPAITINSNNRIVVVFASTTEGYDNGTFNFKHIIARGSDDNGETWLDFYDLNTNLIHIFDECIYPVLAGSTNEFFHLIYNADPEVGTALDEDHPYVENKIYYSKMLLEDIGLSPWVGIEAQDQLMESVVQNYPNPFSESTVLSVTLAARAELSVDILSITGQKVKHYNKGIVQPGTHFFRITSEGLTPGIYFYIIKANNTSQTGKMMVE